MSHNPSSNSLCCENVDGDDTFNNLYTKFCEEHDNHEKTKILNLLVQAYVLHFKDKEGTEEKINELIELLSQVPDLCYIFLQLPLNNETKEFQNLDGKKENLESAGLCFDLMLACLETFCETQQGLVMMKISLNILCQGYNHCKESEAIYGELLESFSNQLGFFFKKIESLQIVVLQLLEKLDIKEIPNDNLHLNCIILEMGNLCEVVFSLDADIAFELWSKYMRIITDHDSPKQISNINSISSYLALKNIEVLEIMKFNADKNSEEDEELCAKFFFYFDALSSVLNLVPDSFKENILQFRTFLLNLFDCLVLSYSHFVEKSCMNIVKNSLEKNTFTFLSYLYRDEEFLNSVLSVVPDKENLISVYLLKLCALQFMECASLQLKENILKDMLSNNFSASFEDDMKLLYTSIPVCIVTEKSSRSVTLYQFAYEQLAEFSKQLPNSVINKLGNMVIDFLISTSDVFYLLISDVWIYRLRCSSIDFLKSQCSSLIHYCREKNFKSIKTDNFIKRMLRFLPHSHKEELLRECSNLKLILEDKNIEHRYCIPDLSSTEAEISIDSEEQLKRMVSMLNECSSNDASQLVKKSCICLELCASFVNISENGEILLFSEFAAEMFKSGVYEIQIAVLTFIRALSRKKMQEHTQEFGKIVVCLAQLFSLAMNSKNYIVRYEARNVFSYFAKCTPHIKIVQETIRADPSLKPALKAYINAVPDSDFLSSKAKSEYLRKLMSTAKDFHFEIPKPVIESLKEMFSRSNSLS